MRRSAAWMSALVVLAISGSSAASEHDQRAARKLFQEGSRHYDLAEYDEAIAAFKEAYRLSEVPGLLYNIGQAYRKKGPSGCEQAASFYRSYLRVKPEVEEREEIEAWI